GWPPGLKAGDHWAGIPPGLDELDGPQAPDRRRLLGHPDRPHAALAELLYQLVRANDRAGGFWRRRLSGGARERPGGRRFGRGLLQEAAPAFVEAQQALHL